MVGGQVIEVCDVPGRPEVLFVDCADFGGGRRQRKPDTCAIYVENNPDSRQIQVGDGLWWQGSFAYWTPKENRLTHSDRDMKSGVDYDIAIPRVGFSGVSHPSRKDEE